MAPRCQVAKYFHCTGQGGSAQLALSDLTPISFNKLKSPPDFFIILLYLFINGMIGHEVQQ